MRRSRARRCTALTLLATAVSPAVAGAGPADVLEATARCRGEHCDFEAQLRHADTGWEHYADRFEIVAPDGEILATRVLRHPHVEEQPFTRGLRGVFIPEAIRRVRVRAGDSLHGLGGREVEIELERAAD